MTGHTEIPAWEGPAYCTGCDWESRRIGINSHDQFLYHLASLRHARDARTFDTATAIETALRFVCKDDDGRLYAPISEDFKRPYVYVPGYSIHAEGEEIHMISVYHSGEIEVLVGNGYTLTEGRLIDVLRGAITAS